MANELELTGEFDVVAQFSIPAVNRVLAAQHQDETYLHSIPAVVPAEGLPWVRIDDADTGVRGTAQIQISTPTVTFPVGENTSRVAIHYQIMAYMVAGRGSAAVPEFVHGEIRVTVDVPQKPWEDGDPIGVDLGAEDLEVTFTPDPGAPLSDEETIQVNQIIRNVLRTGFEPVSSVVDLRGEALRVQQWWVKTMPGDQRPAVALLLNLSDKKPEADPATVTEVFLGEEGDFAIAIGRDFLKSRLVDLMRKALPQSIKGKAELKGFLGITWASGHCTVTVDSVDVDLGEGRIQLSVDGDVTAHGRIVVQNWRVDGTFTVTQDFTLIPDRGSISLDAPDNPHLDLRLNLPVGAGFVEKLIVDETQDKVLEARGRILTDAQPLMQRLSAGFCDILPNLRIPAPDVVYKAVEIQAGGVIVRGTLDFGPWQDVVATFEAKSTWPSATPKPLLGVPSMFQDDLERRDLSQEFRMIVLEELDFPLSDNPIITTEEENSRWRIDDQGRTFIVIKEGEVLNICDPVDIDLIDWELNALNSWIPGGTIERFRWLCDGEEIASEEHKFITRFTGPLPRVRGDEHGFQPPEWCLEVSGVQGSPPKEISRLVCQGVPPVGPRPIEDIGGGGLLVDVSDSEGGVVAHIDPWRPAVWSATSRPGRLRPRLSGGVNLLVQFPGSESTQTWILGEALARRNRKDAAVFVVVVVPPGLVVEPLKLGANIAWARTADAEQAWVKAFGVTATPASFLVNPQGKTVWQHFSRLDAATFAAALDEHLVAGGPLRWQQLRLKVQVGQPAPDFIFEYLQGRRIALRRLRRRPVLLNFWKSWSAPCLAELRHLQKLHKQFAKTGLVILAINDGEDPQRAREVFKENGFTFNFVADADREIAELYGVNCWPTTISLNEKGGVRHIQFGLTPDKGSMRLQRSQPLQQY